jgi:hypothetical protein
MDYVAEAERHRHMAEEYRTMADNTTRDELRPHYCRLAEAYDALADSEERVAKTPRVAN